MPKQLPTFCPLFRASFFVSIFALTLAAGIPVRAHAQDQKGRLGDGRAYRTDAEGNQIIDYLAELEIENQTLKERIRGLEGEASIKQQAIERLRNSGSASPALTEKNLLPDDTSAERRQPAAVAISQVAQTACPAAVPASCPAFTCPEFQCPPVEDSSAEVQTLQGDLKNLKVDFELEKRSHERTKAALTTLEAKSASNAAVVVNQKGSSCPAARYSALDCTADISPVKQELAEVSAALKTVRLDLQNEQSAKSKVGSELNASQQEVAKLQLSVSEFQKAQQNKENSAGLLASRDAENANLKSRLIALEQALATKDSQLQVAQAAIDASKGGKPADQTVVAAKIDTQGAKAETTEEKHSWFSRVTSKDSSSDAPAVDTSGTATTSIARSRAVESLRGGLNPEINRIRDLFARRAYLVSDAANTGRSIKVSIQPAVSARGIRAEELSARVKSASSAYELALLRRDIGEIRNVLQEDITVLERMKRSR